MKITTARLKSDGKQPTASDLLHSNVMNGDSSAFMSFTNHVGTASSCQVLLDDEPISFSTLSVVTGVHLSRVGVDLYGTSYGGVVIVDVRTESTVAMERW